MIRTKSRDPNRNPQVRASSNRSLRVGKKGVVVDLRANQKISALHGLHQILFRVEYVTYDLPRVPLPYDNARRRPRRDVPVLVDVLH